MLIELNIVFQDEYILISFNDGSPSTKLSNTIGYDQNNQLVSIGDSLDDLIKKNPQDEQKIKSTLHFEKIYDGSATALKRTELFFEYQLAKIHAEKAGAYSLGFFDKIICHLQMPSYDMIEKESRKSFEYLLSNLLFIPVRVLIVNGEKCGWPRWQIFLARQSHLALIGLPIFSLLWATALITSSEPERIIIYAIPVLGLGLGLYYVLGILWAITMRSFLPRDLLRQILYAQTRRGQKKSGMLESWLLNKFLQDE